MTNVIYARVPAEVKEAVDSYATQRGTTLSSAVVHLLERGLAAVSDEPSIQALQAALSALKTEKAAADAELHRARTELLTLNALSQRAGQQIGKCPSPGCDQAISGYELLAVGRCRTGHALSTLLFPSTPQTTLDQREFMVLLGALGAVLAVALLVSKA